MPAARHERGVAIGPVVAAVGRVASCREVLTPRRGERPNSPMATHEGFLQQAALVHVLEQRARAAVELRAVEVLERAEVGGVRVPGSRRSGLPLATAGQFICTKRVPASISRRESSRPWPKVCRP